MQFKQMIALLLIFSIVYCQTKLPLNTLELSNVQNIQQCNISGQETNPSITFSADSQTQQLDLVNDSILRDYTMINNDILFSFYNEQNQVMIQNVYNQENSVYKNVFQYEDNSTQEFNVDGQIKNVSPSLNKDKICLVSVNNSVRKVYIYSLNKPAQLLTSFNISNNILNVFSCVLIDNDQQILLNTGIIINIEDKQISEPFTIDRLPFQIIQSPYNENHYLMVYSQSGQEQSFFELQDIKGRQIAISSFDYSIKNYMSFSSDSRFIIGASNDQQKVFLFNSKDLTLFQKWDIDIIYPLYANLNSLNNMMCLVGIGKEIQIFQLDICQMGYYKNEDYQCLQCPSKCKECDNESAQKNQCTGNFCSNSSLLLPLCQNIALGQYSVIVNGQVVEKSCDQKCNYCENSSDNCTQCKGNNRDAPTCTCSYGYYQQEQYSDCIQINGQSQINCPDNQYYDQQTFSCKPCYFLNDLCTAECPQNYQIQIQNKIYVCQNSQSVIEDNLLIIIIIGIVCITLIGVIISLILCKNANKKQNQQNSNKFPKFQNVKGNMKPNLEEIKEIEEVQTSKQDSQYISNNQFVVKNFDQNQQQQIYNSVTELSQQQSQIKSSIFSKQGSEISQLKNDHQNSQQSDENKEVQKKKNRRKSKAKKTEVQSEQIEEKSNQEGNVVPKQKRRRKTKKVQQDVIDSLDEKLNE